MRLSAALVAFAAIVPVVAAPAPKTPTGIDLYGKPFDPDKDAEFKGDGDKLTITLPGADKDLSVERNKMNAPRVVREVEGDFVATVKVDGKFAPTDESKTDERVAFVGAGLLLMADDKTYIRLERAALKYTTGEERTYANWELRRDGKWELAGASKTDEQDLTLQQKATWLRLTRKGNKVTGEFSQDGEKWTKLPTLEVELPKKVTLGVAAITTNAKKFAPEFSKYAVEQGK